MNLTTKEKIHIELKRRGRTLQWLADRLGISRQLLDYRLRNGKFTESNRKVLEMLELI